VNGQALGETFVTLMVLMDPIGLAPVFVAFTRRLNPAERRTAAVRATLAAGTLILGFALFGGVVLDYLHVSVESLSIAGGLLQA
jgi:multiple antibiotic resistance protein